MTSRVQRPLSDYMQTESVLWAKTERELVGKCMILFNKMD